MKHLHRLLILMQMLMYVVMVGITFYFGWLMLASIWAAIAGQEDGFERLGRAILYFFGFNFGAGILAIIIQALAEYVEAKIPKRNTRH